VLILAHLLGYLGVPSGAAIVVSIRVMKFLKGRGANFGVWRGRDRGRDR
jgi:hypothetical protein